MKKSSEQFLILDDTKRDAPSQFSEEELAVISSSPALTKEELTEILLSSIID